MQLRHDLLAIVRAGIRAAGARTLLAREFDAVYGGRVSSQVHDTETRPPYVRVIAAGKASAVMAATAAECFGPRIRAGLVVSSAPAEVPPPFEVILGGHPTPTPESERAGRRALEMAASTAGDQTLVVLLSGGASALMAAPAPGVTLDHKRATTERLLRAGADIHALNTVRKHLSAIKGGRLAARTPGRCNGYAISDVVGDDPSVIASGPTAPDPTTYQDAIDVLRRFGGVEAYPDAVVALLARGVAGEVEETPKAGDARLTRARTKIVGSRRDAVAGAAAEARERGYDVRTIDEAVTGEARLAARSHVERLAGLARHASRPLCIVSAGETVVTVRGHGKGGRNQEFVLACADLMPKLGSTALVASIGTDGVDGPTDAAGAVVDSTTAARARSEGLGPSSRYLDDNNAYPFFSALGDLIRIGPTDTNVGDLQVVLVA